MKDIFDFEPQPLRCAVFGNPVAHSKSPRVHGLFAAQFGLQLEYRAVQVDLGGFEQAVSAFQASGGLGLNVTVPFKLNAWRLAEKLSERAQLAEAVNTLAFGDSIVGDNTDGIGLVRDIQTNIGVEIHGANVVLIGAGGASRGVVGPILSCQPASLSIINRTPDKAANLARRFNQVGPVSGGGLDMRLNRGCDIVINSTSSELSGDLPAVSTQLFKAARLAYDLMYSSKSTAFQDWAKKSGAQICVDGLGMLVEQAAESFHIWHGKRPKTATVIKTIRKEL